MKKIINKKSNIKDGIDLILSNNKEIKMAAIYGHTGKVIGIPFDKIKVDKNRNIDLRILASKLNKVNRYYLNKDYPIEDYGQIKFLYLGDIEAEIECLDRLDYEKSYLENRDKIAFDILDEFFNYYEEDVSKKTLEFVLLYKLILDDNEQIANIEYLITYLPESVIERQLLRKEAIEKGQIYTQDENSKSDKTLLERLGIVDNKSTREVLKEVILTLSPLEQSVITLRYGLDNKGARSYREIGDALEIITLEDVKDIEVKAIRKLRHPIRYKRLIRAQG